MSAAASTAKIDRRMQSFKSEAARIIAAMKFCANCGSPTTRRVPPGDSLPRYLCDACGIVHYQNPRLVIGTLPEWEGRVLLCRRAIEPRYGYWTLPAGFMENDETTGEAAARETLEEAGARVELAAPFSMISVPYVNQVHLFYRARLLDLDFKPGVESLEVALYDEAQVPWQEIAFRTVGATLKHWFADRARGAFGFHAEDLK
jgi:ADP-ribose pyrophosphatase YjhB (NUDIX family)